MLLPALPSLGLVILIFLPFPSLPFPSLPFVRAGTPRAQVSLPQDLAYHARVRAGQGPGSHSAPHAARQRFRGPGSQGRTVGAWWSICRRHPAESMTIQRRCLARTKSTAVLASPQSILRDERPSTTPPTHTRTRVWRLLVCVGLRWQDCLVFFGSLPHGMRTLPPSLPLLPSRLIAFFFHRFEIVAPVRFGLVCFRLKATDAANEELR